jgi:hypothetical protein
MKSKENILSTFQKRRRRPKKNNNQKKKQYPNVTNLILEKRRPSFPNPLKLKSRTAKHLEYKIKLGESRFRGISKANSIKVTQKQMLQINSAEIKRKGKILQQITKKKQPKEKRRERVKSSSKELSYFVCSQTGSALLKNQKGRSSSKGKKDKKSSIGLSKLGNRFVSTLKNIQMRAGFQDVTSSILSSMEKFSTHNPFGTKRKNSKSRSRKGAKNSSIDIRSRYGRLKSKNSKFLNSLRASLKNSKLNDLSIGYIPTGNEGKKIIKKAGNRLACISTPQNGYISHINDKKNPIKSHKYTRRGASSKRKSKLSKKVNLSLNNYSLDEIGKMRTSQNKFSSTMKKSKRLGGTNWVPSVKKRATKQRNTINYKSSSGALNLKIRERLSHSNAQAKFSQTFYSKKYKKNKKKSEKTKSSFGIYGNFESSSFLMKKKSLDKGLMMSNFNLNTDDENDTIGAEFKINQLIQGTLKNGEYSIELITENWEDVMYILSQKFMIISYLNCLPKILDLYKFTLDNFWDLNKTQNFKLIYGKGKDPFKYRNISDSLGIFNESRYLNSASKNKSRMTDKLENLMKVMLHELDHEHLFFFRKIVSIYFKVIEEFAGSYMVDFAKLVKEFEEIINFFRKYYDEGEIIILYGFNQFFGKFDKLSLVVGDKEYVKICSIFFDILNSILDHNLRFYRGEINRVIDIDPESLELGKIFEKLLKVNKLKIQLLRNEESAEYLLRLFMLMKEFLLNQIYFTSANLRTKIHILDIFCVSFSLLKSNSLLTFLLKNKNLLGVEVNDFFQAAFLQLINLTQNFRIEKNESGLQKIRYIMTCLKKHLEFNDFFLEEVNFRFDKYLLKETTIFLQKFIKELRLCSVKLVHYSFDISCLILDCIITYITQSVVHKMGSFSLIEFEFIEPHLTEYLGITKSIKKGIPNLEDHKLKLQSKLSLIIKILKI